MAYIPEFTITNSLLNSIIQCEIARELITNSPIIPAWERKFQNQAVVRSVHHSTALEGNKLTLAQTEDIIEGHKISTTRLRDVKEIINYRTVIGFISEIKQNKLTISFILQMHQILGKDILPTKYLGVFRKRNAVIISSASNQVIFDPPPASEIESEITDLLNWENSINGNIHPLIKAGILHYEFVRIHPFADLNGRTARVIATWSLYQDSYDINKYFSLEEYYDQDPKSYYSALDSANNGDLTAWLEYFVKGVALELTLVKEQILAISLDRNTKMKVGQIALNERQLKIISVIEQNKMFTNPDFNTYFPKVSDDTILRDLKDLLEKKVIMKKGKTKAARYILANA